ncbi:unnamed protein product [Agarophyton chilense]
MVGLETSAGAADSKLLQGYPSRALPVLGINHISFAVPQPLHTARFFETVLGFKPLKRPASIAKAVDGAWICGLGLEIHFIQSTERALLRQRPPAARTRRGTIDPRNDHVSFLCTDRDGDSDFERIIASLQQDGVEYVTRCFDEDHLKQLFFCDPTSGLLIEVSTSAMC